MTTAHRKNLQHFIDQTVSVLKKDLRFCGVAISGSWNGPDFDQYSDLDLVLVSHPQDFESVLRDRLLLADKFGNLVSAFTGEHVGENRLLICLYSPPLIHVDLKFVALADFADRIEDPSIAWELDRQLSNVVATTKPKSLAPNYQWIEDRFWTWVHYGAVKIARGEIFEAIGFLDFLRSRVLAPMALDLHHIPVRGVRRIEKQLPDFSTRLTKTIPEYNTKSCHQSLLATVQLYQELREMAQNQGRHFSLNRSAENESLRFMTTM